MGWEDLNKALRKVYPGKRISCDDQKTLKTLQKIIKSRYPYMRKEGIQEVIKKTCADLDAPCEREEFLQRLLNKMNEVPYGILVGKSKFVKNDS